MDFVDKYWNYICINEGKRTKLPSFFSIQWCHHLNRRLKHEVIEGLHSRMKSFEFIIDTREKKIIEYFQGDDSKKFENVRVQTLDIGDVHCIREGKTVLVIERKSLDDLAASIKDGRYREQKLRLKSSGLEFVYLLEGIVRNTGSHSKINRLPTKTVVSSILNMCIRDKIKMLSTPSVHHTLYFLHQVYDKLRKKPELFVPSASPTIPGMVSFDEATKCIIKSEKKQNMTPKMCAIAQLAQIPSVSRVIAKGLVELYGSMYGLCMVYMSKETDIEKQNMLTNKTYVSYSGQIRPFGPHISKQVYEYICC